MSEVDRLFLATVGPLRGFDPNPPEFQAEVDWENEGGACRADFD